MKKPLILILVILLCSFIYAVEIIVTSSFNDMLSKANVTFTGERENITKILSIPRYTNITSASINVTGTSIGIDSLLMMYKFEDNSSTQNDADVNSTTSIYLGNISGQTTRDGAVNGIHGLGQKLYENPVDTNFGASEKFANFSMSIWVNFTTLASNDAIFSNIQHAFGGVGVNRFTNTINLQAFSVALGDEASTTTGASISANEWYHIVLTAYNGSQKVYINGDENLSLAVSDLKLVGSDFLIGSVPLFAENDLNGTVDEFMFIKDRILTTGEIAYLYNDGIGRDMERNNTFNLTVYIGGNNSELIDDDSLTINETIKHNFNLTYLGGILSSGCNCPSCSISGNLCLIPFDFNSISPGAFTYSNMNVNLEWDLDNCSIYDTHAINYTVLDELNSTSVYVDIDGTYNHTANGQDYSTYTLNKNDGGNFSICISPSYLQITVDYNFRSLNDVYPSRRLIIQDDLFTSTTQNFNIYMLHNNEGVFQSFKVIDSADDPVSGVLITIRRTLDGQSRIVTSDISDDSGIATFWLYPFTNYEVTFSKGGFDDIVATVAPSSGELLTVDIGGGIGKNIIKQNETTGRGLRWDFYPKNQILVNNTDYLFSFNLTSDVFTITACNLLLTNSTYVLGSSTSSFSDNACNIGIAQNTLNYTTIVAEATFLLNTSQLYNISYVYLIGTYYQGEFSLKTFIDNIAAFSGAGFNDFTRLLIAFILILVLTIAVSRFAGITNPEGILILILVLIFILSYLSFLRIPLQFPFLEGVTEGHMQRFMMFYMSSLLVGGYVISRHTR